MLADEIGRELGDSVVVENRTGADGRIGVRAVKAAAADGRTLLFTPFGAMVLFPSVYDELPYDPVQDFVPVSQLVTYDFGLAAGPSFPGKNLADLVTWLKADPKRGTWGMPGYGSLPHFLPLRFATLAGVEMKSIAYKGTVPAVTDVMAGQIPLVCAPLSDLVEPARNGAIRLLATSGAQRSAFSPEAPTFLEQGFDVVGAGWYALYAPAGSPPDFMGKLNRIVVAAVRSPAGQELAARLKLTPTGTSAAELAAIQQADFARWAGVVKASGFRAQ